MTMPRTRRVINDLLCLVVFVAIGRSTHDHGVALRGMITTLWPFVVGLVASWAVLVRRHRSGASFADASLIVVLTVTLGMVLRVIAGQGTAVAFIVVALAFLSLTIGGWRLVAHWWRRWRS